MKNDIQLSLALSHARLIGALDMIIQSRSSEMFKVVDQKSFEQVVVKIKIWADLTRRALQESK